jgi:hypothetical protein
VFYGVFVDEEVDEGGDKGSGDTTMVDVQTLLEAFLNMCLICTCFTDYKLFLVKSKTSSPGAALLKC